MKREIKPCNAIILSMVLAIVFAVAFTSCKKNTLSAQEIAKMKLIANTWIMQSVRVDGVDQTAIYKGLTINFTPATYETTNGGVVWPASGTWKFTSSDFTTLKREDGIEVQVEVADETLNLSLTWAKTTLSGGRLGSIKGRHIFSFGK